MAGKYIGIPICETLAIIIGKGKDVSDMLCMFSPAAVNVCKHAHKSIDNSKQ